MEDLGKHDVLVLGAGAAGCMAASRAGQRGRSVLLIDNGARVGGKIHISGGGRCNFTNRGASAEHYLSNNPHFVKSALASYSAADTEAWVAAAEIPYHEKTLGQLFCDRSAKDMLGLLEKDLAAAKVKIAFSRTVRGAEKEGQGFRVFGHEWEARGQKLIIALGGLSYPNLGATDLGYALATGFGHNIIERAPALDGFVLQAADYARIEGLAGLSLPARIEIGARSFDEGLLITHKGLSGPVALQASLYWRAGLPLKVNLWPFGNAEEEFMNYKRAYPKAGLADLLALRWPRRLAEQWIDFIPEFKILASEVMNRVSDKIMRDLAASITSWIVTPSATVGYHKAEVTRGGVDTQELNQKNMESKLVPGLYVIGEVVDVTGELGGYNFQWAWSSGFVAGEEA